MEDFEGQDMEVVPDMGVYWQLVERYYECYQVARAAREVDDCGSRVLNKNEGAYML